MRSLTRHHTSNLMTGVSSPRGSDIVKSGHLHIKRPPSQQSIKIRLKAWQKRYFVLRDDSFESTGTTVLEMYDSQAAWMQAEREAYPSTDLLKYTVDLRTITHVDEYLESKCFNFAFVVTRCGQSPLVMGAETELEMKEWMVAIKLLSDKMKNRLSAISGGSTGSSGVSRQESVRRPSCPSFLRLSAQLPQPQPRTGGSPAPAETSRKTSSSSHSPQTSPGRLHSPPANTAAEKVYPVTVVTTDAATRCAISGQHYAMCVTAEDVVLRHLSSLSDVIRWPLSHVKKFKSEPMGSGVDHVVMETTKQSGPHEGTFIFATMCGSDIVDQVRTASRNLSRKQDWTTRFIDHHMSRLKLEQALPANATNLGRAPSAPCLSRIAPLPSPSSLHVDTHSRFDARFESRTSLTSTSAGEQHVIHSVHNGSVPLGAGYLELLKGDDDDVDDDDGGGDDDDPLSANIPNPLHSYDADIRASQDSLENVAKDKSRATDRFSAPPPLPPRSRLSATPTNRNSVSPSRKIAVASTSWSN